jgi:1-acyl-sn-glycerol-3-phosphate acyltransferase
MKSESGKTPNILVVITMNIMVVFMLSVWTLFSFMVSPVAFTVIKLFTFKSNNYIARKLIWLYGRGWLVTVQPFVSFQREGLKSFSFKEPCIFVVNHLSFFDTYCMSLLPNSDACFAIRSWPFRMFFYRPFMNLARYLDVESLEWAEILKKAKNMLENGSSIIFFPEGHRSRDGECQRFYSGAFKLSIETGFPVVPLCLTGTDVFFPPGRFWFSPARIKLRILAPEYPESFQGHSMSHTEMRQHVKVLMAENIKEMNDA